MDSIFINKYSKEEWIFGKKKETLNLILDQEYGFRNKAADEAKLEYQVVEDKVVDDIHIKACTMKYMDLTMRFYLYMPNDNKVHKTFLLLLHEYAEDKSGNDLVNGYKNIYLCPIKEAVDRGYIIAMMPTREIAPDGMDFRIRRKRDIFTTINEVRYENDWGTLQAWSWGLSKVMDYLETLPNVDKDNVAVIGHSRGGKTALLTGAQDERFKLVVSSCSGQSGAAISRNRIEGGETLRIITTMASYWFAPYYFDYADHPELLPFDQHQLLGLIAPRYLYVFSASEDLNADPASELLSCRYASQYFELFGEKGLIAPENVELDKSYNEGHIAYHIKTGKHSLETRDWRMVMDYFDKI
ncbi:MAG: hypothetical protein MJ248_06715 [Bacilli bacterium]|nr:hypothetical protein [Bacilli bacterium]